MGAATAANGVNFLAPAKALTNRTVTDLNWSNLTKLLCYTGLSVAGSIGNIFTISSVMIQDHLRKKGNIFVVNLALTDLVISVIVIPSNVVAVLSGQDRRKDLCHLQWFIIILCCLISLLTMMNIAIENWLRLFRSSTHRAFYTIEHIMVCLLIIWFLSIVTVSSQYLLKLGPDYCTMYFQGTLVFHVVVGTFFVVLPTIVSFTCFITAVIDVKHVKSQHNLELPASFSRDYSTMKTNFCVFTVFLLLWLPFGISICVGSVYRLSPTIYENFSLCVLSNSCVKGFVYCFTNRYFRYAFVNLFHYCFCKTSVSFSSRRLRSETTRSSEYVRVHIIPGYNIYSSGNSSASTHPHHTNSSPARKEMHTKFPNIKRPFMNKPRVYVGQSKNVYQL